MVALDNVRWNTDETMYSQNQVQVYNTLALPEPGTSTRMRERLRIPEI